MNEFDNAAQRQVGGLRDTKVPEQKWDQTSRSVMHRNRSRGTRVVYATFLSVATTLATVAPISAGVGHIVTPAALRISTFSAADSP